MDISINDFRKFKKFNMEILPDLVPFIDNNTNMINTKWKHYDNQTSWIKNKEVDKDKILLNKFRMNINKISVLNYDSILEDILKEKYTIEIINNVIDFLFNKIINESNNLDIFIKLIQDLKKIENFFKLFMNKCQITFEEIKNTSFSNEINTKQFRSTVELKTFIQFIIKLSLNKMLGLQIIITCILNIIDKINNSYNPIDLLIIYTFFNSILDKSIKDNRFIEYFKQNKNLLDEFKEKLEVIKNIQGISKKEYFQIIDIFELFESV